MDDVPWRVYVDARLTSHEQERRYLVEHLESQDRRIEDSLNRRIEAVTNMVRVIEEQTQTYLPREVYENRHEDLKRDLESVARRVDELAGSRAGSATTIGFVIAGAGLVASVLIVVLSHLWGG